MVEPAVLFLLALFVGILTFVLLAKTGKVRFRAGHTREAQKHPYPLYGSLLVKGELVKTVVYPGKINTLAEMFGCPYCYGEKATAVRICPVCNKPLSEDGYVIGRMFEERRRLHVIGCTGCRKRK